MSDPTLDRAALREDAAFLAESGETFEGAAMRLHLDAKALTYLLRRHQPIEKRLKANRGAS